MELTEDNVKVILNDGSSMGRKLYGSIEIAVEKEEHFNRDESKADRVKKATEEVKKQILENQENIKRVNDMMVEMNIKPPLELWLANSIKWKDDAEAHRFWMASDFPKNMTVGDVHKWQRDAESWNLYLKQNNFTKEDGDEYMRCLKDREIVERLKKRIGELNKQEYFTNISQTIVAEFQAVLNGKQWTDKHTKIAEEASDRFKTHTKDEEVDI